MPITSEAKQLLSRTIRELRARLLRDLHDAAESRYRLAVPLPRAGLTEDAHRKRERLEAWLDERARATGATGAALAVARARFREEAELEAAATLLNRLVLLRQFEALGLSKPAVVTGGWNSRGYRELRDFAPALLDDATEGYATLLALVFDELALDLPGLFGDVGLTRLFPVPPATLREVVERLDDPALQSAWTDDTTLGWVYQYWNDPAREALDAKIAGGGKIEPHEIASKTQMFTERYMVEWLLQNSLGATWLAMCRKHNWRADAEDVLPVLDARRADWRRRREAGEVALDALMPIDAGLEEHWKYYVPQPIPDAVVDSAPDSVRTLKLIDPACGSGHFLVIAFDLLAALYREEAKHRGEEWSDEQIANSILENNLHGVDIDPRPIQLAAAGLYLKARVFCRTARPGRLNLVASNLRLADLPKDDPALAALRREVRAGTGIPEELVNRIIDALKGADHLGTLLKVDAAIDAAVREQEGIALASTQPAQGNLLSGAFPVQQRAISFETARRSVVARLEQFLEQHGGEHDLGLRLDGEQLAAGLRFIRLVKENTYDVVVGNPPYQGTSKMSEAKYVAKHYPRGKADLYAAFFERGLELARKGGVSAMVTMRGWMFLAQFTALRESILQQDDLRVIGDVDRGAFESVPNEVLAASMAVVRKLPPTGEPSVAMQPTPLSDKSYDRARTDRKRAAILAQAGRYEFAVGSLEAIEGQPLVYWWDQKFLAFYASAPKLGRDAPVRAGMTTGNNLRFLRLWWEVERSEVYVRSFADRRAELFALSCWIPYVAGGEGRTWFNDLSTVLLWKSGGLQKRVVHEFLANQGGGNGTPSKEFYFQPGVAFAMIGTECLARAHRFPSIFGDKGSSVFPRSVANVLCMMNSSVPRFVLQSLNPTISFQVGDVNRLPVVHVAAAEEIYASLEAAFAQHESAREASIEFKCPGPTEWRAKQAWAQRAVDRAEADALPVYIPAIVRERPSDVLSFSVGVALGRFTRGERSVITTPLLPLGILFISAAGGRGDSLDHDGAKPIIEAWAEHGRALAAAGSDLREWLRMGFFKHHRETYENRPIWFPLSSSRKSFVAWMSIHRWTGSTLSALLAEYLVPERRRLEGELDDLRQARANGPGRGNAQSERRFADVQKLLGEMNDFIALVTQCAERGPPPTAPGETPREVDARYEMDLDDGVMVNSAALWPLLEPQWKDPKKWWKELATAKGRKDYDWAHLSKRYFPQRVESKCVEEPSLAVAHGCFWRLHPAKAYAWELRLQDEIGPGFTIDEPGSDEARAKFLADHKREAEELIANERRRRERKAAKAEGERDQAALFDADDEPADE